MCVAIPLTPTVRSVDAPAEVPHEDGHTRFLHFHSGVLALIFLVGRIPPFLFFVDRKVELCGLKI